MRGLAGHLDITCALDRCGQSVLTQQSFRAPIHLSKPHHDAGALVVNVVNPTAGLLEGDRIHCRVAVESGARLVLTTPSASRAHRMRGGGRAELRQELRVAEGASLEFWPELFIPQAGTRYRQRTIIDVAEGAELLFFESLAPGRVAAGEAFEFEELVWETDIRFAGRPAARERYRLAPQSESIRTIRRIFQEAYYASVFIFSPQIQSSSGCWERLHALQTADTWIGAGTLGAGGFVVKCLASGSVAMRRVLQAIRDEVYAALGRPAPSVRRTGLW